MRQQRTRLKVGVLELHVGGSLQFNVAYEEALLEEAEVKGETVARVWVNRECVVIGYTLKPCEEVKCDVAAALRVDVVRRVSGGGAVYHDQGNINVTLAVPEKLSVAEGYAIITGIVSGALQELGVKAVVENFNDVVVRGRKVSGSSLAIRGKATLAHATLLVNSNLSRMSMLLKPRWERVASGDVKPSKYMPDNLSSLLDWDPSRLASKIIQALEAILDPSEVGGVSALARARDLCSEKYVKGFWSPVKSGSSGCREPASAGWPEIARTVAGGVLS